MKRLREQKVELLLSLICFLIPPVFSENLTCATECTRNQGYKTSKHRINPYLPGAYRQLETECLCPPQSRMLKPNPQYNGISRCGLWEVIR